MVIVILSAVVATSFISGILGMGGGMILIGILSLSFPITSAMILHGITQMGSNGFRAYLLRKHIKYKVLPFYFLGSLTGFALFSLVNFVPSKGLVLVLVGSFPILYLLTPKSLSFDIMKSSNSFMCGVIIISMQIMSGTSGPSLDVFFIKSNLNKYEIIATKAITQTIGHILKIIYYLNIIYLSSDLELEVQALLFPAVVICAFGGTRLGKIVLDRLSEVQFRKYSRLLITLIGVVYLCKGVSVLL